MKPFTILHLSDAHIGFHDGDAQIVLQPLFKRLKQDVAEIGIPQLLVFSGDLVWGQEGEKPKPIAFQFEQAQVFLDKIYEALGTTSKKTPLAIVPGNHDLNRDELDPAQRDYAKKLTRQKVEALIKNPTHWGRYVARQKAFAEFVKKYQVASDWIWDEQWITWRGVIDHEGVKIAVVGLNSSWTSYTSEERGNLWIGGPQTEMALTFGEECQFRILVTHHPTWWLSDEEQTMLQAQIESRFQLHLHGHEHFGWFTDPTGHVRVAAGACYQGSKMQCGFNWLTLNLDPNTDRSITLRLRTFVPEPMEWVERNLGRKAPNGKAVIDSPWRERPDSSSTQNASPLPTPSTNSDSEPTPFASVRSGAEFCEILQNYFLADTDDPQIPSSRDIGCVYWPVRRRNPTIVHAAQAFIAAGLALKGAKVMLWVDDVGKNQDDEQRQLLINKLQWWYEKVKGPAVFEKRFIQDLLQDPNARHTCETFKRWLSEHDGRSLQKVLEISKVIRTKSPTLSDILEEKPYRLLNPPLVWTGLVHVLESEKHVGFATLGGVDERELWKTWGVVYPQATKAITHIYCAKLIDARGEPYDMDKAEWRGKGQIENELKLDLEQSSSPEHFVRLEGMAQWCFIHFVQLPAYLLGRVVALPINDKVISQWSDVTPQDSKYLPAALAAAMAPWIS